MPWNDPSSYDYTSAHDNREWGWEFIRRDGGYREEWAREIAHFHEIAGNQDRQRALFSQEWRRKLMEPDLSDFAGDDSPPLYNFYDETEINTFVIMSENARKWGLRGYQNPTSRKLNKQLALGASTICILPSGFGDDADTVSVAAIPYSLVSIIELKKPLQPQIEHILSTAQKTQSWIKENRPTEEVTLRPERVSHQDRARWLGYLRCLDAKEAGVKRQAAAPKIFGSAAQGPEFKWDEALKQIREIAARNYRLFMA